jgi:solute carrier family 25 folate transporter 32
MGSAVAAGALSDLICNPMFVVRTRLQTEAIHNLAEGTAGGGKSGILETMRQLYGEGGIRTFWRGMTANLLGLSHVAVQFPVYEQLKRTLRGHRHEESAADLLLASGLSKMTASLLTYPHEVIRSRMMDARTAGGVSFVATCAKIYRAEGVLGFYAGLPVSLIRVIPNTCMTFLTYELFLRWTRKKMEEQQRRSHHSS